MLKGEKNKYMRKIVYGFLIVCALSGCSQKEYIDDAEDDAPLIADVKIPRTVFNSTKKNQTLNKEEMKRSIQTYLDSDEKLERASEPFEDNIYDGEKLSKSESKKLNRINKLIEENDKSFSQYISNNTLPEGYQEESERISRYITASNEYIHELNTIIDKVSDGDFSKLNIGSLIEKNGVVNGKEQKKIEAFLDKENIQTIAFGREDTK